MKKLPLMILNCLKNLETFFKKSVQSLNAKPNDVTGTNDPLEIAIKNLKIIQVLRN